MLGADVWVGRCCKDGRWLSNTTSGHSRSPTATTPEAELLEPATQESPPGTIKKTFDLLRGQVAGLVDVAMDYRKLFADVHRRPVMFTLDGSFHDFTVFIRGCNAGNDWQLGGFHQRVV
ncbi:hypothetical protein O3597_25680 [Verrucosispora sp. WMMA2044]|uniref:hypothetical protein n=1 Tax=Verrucosispora sp. WMMA2044 TaxID=3016419 RepID=UPI00248B800B|nr:hypothetical protein [Verrucosispora sp. WMMA2044]WBB48433.1 hypothetical protein O3597_25680 [Verrucosispora sp. WMMA2044]